MNTVVAVNTSNAIPTFASSIRDIPLSRIQESKTNPRRTFDEAKLAELAGNIRQHGVLQPVLVRPLPDGEDGFYELVAGARRYRASRLAERETIPATVRELTDTECLELQLIENLQRALGFAFGIVETFRGRTFRSPLVFLFVGLVICGLVISRFLRNFVRDLPRVPIYGIGPPLFDQADEKHNANPSS